MRKVNANVEDIMKKITELKGEKIHMQINRGRKKYENYTGVIESIYPSVFIVKLLNATASTSKLSCSFSDVLCGDVKISASQVNRK